MDRNEIGKKLKVDMSILDFLPRDTVVYRDTEESKKSHNIGQLAKQYGDGPPDFYPKTFEVMMDTGKHLGVSYQSVTQNPKVAKTTIDEKTFNELMDYAKSLGLHDIGFTKVKPKYIFKDRAILHDNAIVLMMEMDTEAIQAAPSRETGHEVHWTYNKLGRVSNQLAEFLREKGFSVQAGPAMGGDVDYKHLAESAALGAIGNHGLLISPEVGPRQRITALYTNMDNLPMAQENTHLWIKDFCKSCNICGKKCPADALVGIEVGMKTKEYIDLPKCARSFSTSYGCSICIKECVFNKADYDKVKESFLNK